MEWFGNLCINKNGELITMTTDTATLKENFQSQLTNVDGQITKLEDELAKAKEYRLKLQGGLETLELLNPTPTEEAAPAEEVAE